MPKPQPRNGKRVACIGAGPASLTVARDLAPLGYDVTVFDGEAKAGGFIRTQIPRFRLPESVIDEETGYILDLGVTVQKRPAHRLDEGAAGRRATTRCSSAAARRAGATWTCPAARRRRPASTSASTGWRRCRSAITAIGRRVIVLGGGNTAMDCCRSARRLGGTDVKVVVRSGFDEMKASPWEKEDAQHEGIPILNFHVPKAFVHEDGKLTGMTFEIVRRCTTTRAAAAWCPPASPMRGVPCDEVLVAVGQENAFPWIERDCGIEFDRWGLPVLDEGHHQSTLPNRCSSAAMRPLAPRTSSPPWRTATRRRCRSTAAATARTWRSARRR
jgi:formate dehydrogenase beta subunit